MSHAAVEAPVVVPTPAGLLDLARRLSRRIQLAQNAGVRRGGLGRSHGDKAGEGTRHDGQRNSSIHFNSLPF
jgi:hypothetical protein